MEVTDQPHALSALTRGEKADISCIIIIIIISSTQETAIRRTEPTKRSVLQSERWGWPLVQLKYRPVATDDGTTTHQASTLHETKFDYTWIRMSDHLR
jgi:hypothetical protein